MAVVQTLRKNSVNQSDLVLLLTDMQTAINALIANHNTLIAKLNADAGVTDVNYAVSTASTISGVA